MKKLLTVISVLAVFFSCSRVDGSIAFYQGDSPVWPDYRNIVVPPSIAPLNFRYVNAGRDTRTVFSYAGGTVSFKGAEVRWNPRKWRRMMECGGVVNVHSTALDEDWTIEVSSDDIDYGVVYRLIPPGYEKYGKMGIYEQELSSCRQRAVLENSRIDGNCVNCHAFRECSPDSLTLHIRGSHSGTLIKFGDEFDVFNTKISDSASNCVYPYWHPQGRYIAYSTNNTKQSFCVHPQSVLEVFDLSSDVWVYDTRSNRLISNPSLSGDAWLETFPAFSSDGRTMYFCRAPKLDTTIAASDNRLHYNICSVSFDPGTGEPGTDVKVLVNAGSKGKSALFPRPSYDGRFLMYTLCDYGTFPIWHREADLWMMDLSTGRSWPLENANSPDTESFHNWSSNSRWVVLSSRRDDGRFTRLYLTHIDADGNASRAFLLPQESPAEYYDELMFSYNVPAFVTGPVSLREPAATFGILSKKREAFRSR